MRYAIVVALATLAGAPPAGAAVLHGRAGDDAGAAVAAAGDVNGDGRADTIVGSPLAGRATVVFGGGHGDLDLRRPGRRGFVVRGPREFLVGAAVAAAGDVNGDGVDDVLVGAPLAPGNVARTPIAPPAGEAWVVFGSRRPRDLDLRATGARAIHLRGIEPGARFGRQFAALGDVTGDGRDDVAVGLDDEYGPAYAAVVVYGRGPGVVDVSRRFAGGHSVFSTDTGGRFPLAPAGDVDGDGRSDLLIGMSDFDRSRPDGLAYVVYGREREAPVVLERLGGDGVTIDGRRIGLGQGPAIGAGDVDGDGTGDFAMGDPRGARGAGRVRIVLGRRGVPVVDAAHGFWVTGAREDGQGAPDLTRGDAGARQLTAGDGFGATLAAAGDLTGDGRADLLVGAPGYDAKGRPEAGGVFVVSGPGRVGRPRLTGPAAGARAGHALAIAADRLVAGAPGVGQVSTAGRWRRTRPQAAAIDLRPRHLQSDGSRYVAIDERTVWDTARGTLGALPDNPGCRPVQLRRGRALLDCQASFPVAHGTLTGTTAAIVDLAHRTVRPVANSRLASESGARWLRLGEHWISGVLDCYHCDGAELLNIRTGERRSLSGWLREVPAHDLDAPDLKPRPGGPREWTVDHGGVTGELTIRRGRRKILLSRCRPACGGAQVGAGRVSWQQGDVVHGMDLRSRRRVRWTPGRSAHGLADPRRLNAGFGGGGPSLVQTRSVVIFDGGRRLVHWPR